MGRFGIAACAALFVMLASPASACVVGDRSPCSGGFFGYAPSPFQGAEKQKVYRQKKIRKAKKRKPAQVVPRTIAAAVQATTDTARTVAGYAEHVANETLEAMTCAGRKITAGRGMITIKTPSGKCFVVAREHAKAFHGFVAELEAAGYKIDAIGGYAYRRIDPRYCRGGWRSCLSNHARGKAIDINQISRNRVTRPLPANVTEIAARHGLKHGAVWNSPDQGHFEISSPARKRYASKRIRTARLQ